ncbi:hypothetical protein KDW_25460 [Dictyobacter vulcani]|uniref:Uncharacterized protein n=1 Tax=Dictyobacter vulcani TaxID=2607529 RepID=A0A5J4KG12_9CHLR|nr:sigma-70 family RNA polymerase sigma factor [Dictyobacter vulcani]GER88384.1 hypothetical protein KDW_25460 [Dictyobacter vulcani]
MAASQTADYGPILTNEEQYRRDVANLIDENFSGTERLSLDQEKILIQRARVADSLARSELIEYCLSSVTWMARKYAEICHCNGRRRVEYLDLVQIGNLTLVECLDKALAHTNPIGYLKRAALGEIVKHCMRHGSLITSPQERGGKVLPMMQVDSYDVLLVNHSGSEGTYLRDLLEVPNEAPRSERDFTPLYAALDTLTPGQREVIKRHYGVDCAAEDLFTISCSMRAAQGKPFNRNANDAYSAHKGGIASLGRKLAPLVDRAISA